MIDGAEGLKEEIEEENNIEEAQDNLNA